MTILNQIGDPHAWHSAVSELIDDPELFYTELKSLASHKNAEVVESLQIATKDCKFYNDEGYMDSGEFGRFIDTLNKGIEWLKLSLNANNATQTTEINILKEKLESGNPSDCDIATWAVIRLFGRSAQPVKIPFAVVINGTGSLCWLELLVLDDGLNRAIPHPIHYLRSSLNRMVTVRSSFEKAIESAWSLVRDHQASINRPNTVMEGYWRVIADGGGLGNQPIDGGSAGGAAIYGWYHALTKTEPDKGLIVLATAPSDVSSDSLGKVDEVNAKAEAIGSNERFDTIVVADDDNYKEAVKGLKNAGFSLCGTSSADSPEMYLSKGDRVIRVVNLVHWYPPG